MNKNEIKEYLSKNLKIEWSYDYDRYKNMLVLTLEGDAISEVDFDID